LSSPLLWSLSPEVLTLNKPSASSQLKVTSLLTSLFLSKVLHSRSTQLPFLPRWVLPKLVLIWVLVPLLSCLPITSDGLSTTVLLLTLTFQPSRLWLMLTVLQLTSQTRLLALSVVNLSQLWLLLMPFHLLMSPSLWKNLSKLMKLKPITLLVLPLIKVNSSPLRLVQTKVFSDSDVLLPLLVQSSSIPLLVLIRPTSLSLPQRLLLLPKRLVPSQLLQQCHLNLSPTNLLLLQLRLKVNAQVLVLHGLIFILVL